MSHALHVMLASAELDDFDFLAAAMPLHGGGYLAAVDERRPDANISAFTHHQYLIEINRITGTGIQLFYPQRVPLGNAILLSARLDYRIHIWNSKRINSIVEKWPLILMIAPGEVNQIPSGA
jgi:hypothetical protein